MERRKKNMDLPDEALRVTDPGSYLRELRLKTPRTQEGFGKFHAPGSSVLLPRLDRTQVCAAESWVAGTNKSTSGRKITPGLLHDWWECCNYWWRRDLGTPPPITKNEVLAMLSGIEDQAQLIRSLGKGVITVRYFADSGSHGETMCGVLKACGYFGIKHIDDIPCGGKPMAFQHTCKWLMDRSQRLDGDPFHMVLVELPPDDKMDRGCDEALAALKRHGIEGFSQGHGFVTVVMGLSPRHKKQTGTIDPSKEIAAQLAELIVGLARDHAALTEQDGGKVRVLTVTGGAACIAYHRNLALFQRLQAELGDVVQTEMIHPSEPTLARQVLEKLAPSPASRDLLIVAPLYFGATRLFAELVPHWGNRVVMVSTDICQDFVRRMAEFPARWAATVATDLGHSASAAVALAERLALAATGEVDPPKEETLSVPVVTVRSEQLTPETPIAELRQKHFAPPLKEWIAASRERAWLRCLASFA